MFRTKMGIWQHCRASGHAKYGRACKGEVHKVIRGKNAWNAASNNGAA